MAKKSATHDDAPYIWRQKSLMLNGETRNFYKYEYADGFLLYVPRSAFPADMPPPNVLYMDLMQ